MSGLHPLPCVKESSLKGIILGLSKSVEQLSYIMKMLSFIPAAISVSAVWVVRVGDAENERVYPSSLSLYQTLYDVLDSSKVFTSPESKSGELYDKMSLITSRLGGLPSGMPPYSETSISEVDCMYEWTELSLSSLHYTVSPL